jgi:hypothetical protein
VQRTHGQKKIKTTHREDQDPVEEEQDPVGGISLSKREKHDFSQRLKDGSWTFKNTMPRKGKDQTFDELVVNSACTRTESTPLPMWYKFKLDRAVKTVAMSADQTVLSTNLFFTELHKRRKCGEEPCVSYSHDFVLDLEPYDVHECIAEGSMGTLYYVSGWLQPSEQNKERSSSSR